MEQSKLPETLHKVYECFSNKGLNMKNYLFIITISTSIVLSQNILKVFNNKDKEDIKVDSTEML